MRTALLALLVAAPLAAQQAPNPPESRADRFMRNCDDYGDRDREPACEVRDVTMKAPSHSLLIDGRDNGSVHVFGWDKSEVLVRALITTSADRQSDAKDMLKDVTIEASGDRIRSDGPSYGRRRYWSVSFEVWVPRKTSLDAETSNGSVAVTGVDGKMDLRAENGSISIKGVSGDVRGVTSNGSVNAELDGASWKGEGLDLTTSNGSVNLDIPKGYNARLETGTVNGGMNIDFPITIQGNIGRRITTTLGSGGPRIRAVTTNGGVRIRER
ncbi:MAG TPA: DUF4097 family beta strand repeat-containing protein [Gemmatimonadaceae bacterium]